jgi:AraC-like DNA-binding protein
VLKPPPPAPPQFVYEVQHEASRLIERLPEMPVEDNAWLASIVSEEIGDGIRLNRFDFVTELDHSVWVSGPPTFCLAIVIEGHGSLAIENGPSLPVEPGTTVLFHAPRPVRGQNVVRAGSRMRCLDFRFSPESLARIGVPELSALVRGAVADCSVHDALLAAYRTSPALAALAHDVVSCPYDGDARRLYLQAKALEALAALIAAGDVKQARQLGLNARDRERVRQAAALLTMRYSEPWTIASLARAVGLNEKKLKSGFRLIVGRTVHAYLEDTRLAAAAHLLASGATSVTQAALAAGYANPSHFAKLFRRRHGVPPARWLRR